MQSGYAATSLDSACTCAVHSRLTTSQACTTLELKVLYHKQVTKIHGLLRAEGQLLSFGQRVAFAEAKLTDKRGKLYASSTSTLLVFNSDCRDCSFRRGFDRQIVAGGFCSALGRLGDHRSGVRKPAIIRPRACCSC